jgi:hypothetical protein
MGYRSQVAYVINFNSNEKRDAYINLVLATGNSELIKALKDCEVPIPLRPDKDNTATDWQACRINFYANDVKWYDSYPDVQAHTRLYKWAEELYPDDCGWRFIRVGEEEGDIQEDTDDAGNETPEDDFYTVTSIETPFNTNYEPFDVDAFLTTTKEEA